jgi:hypothetical protein
LVLSLFLHSFFLHAVALFFAFCLGAQNAKQCRHLWLLLSPITMESIQKSTEKLSPHVVMTSLVYIQVQDNCREKVIYLQYFLQGPCSYGQRRLCLGLCIHTILTLRSTISLNFETGSCRLNSKGPVY